MAEPKFNISDLVEFKDSNRHGVGRIVEIENDPIYPSTRYGLDILLSNRIFIMRRPFFWESELTEFKVDCRTLARQLSEVALNVTYHEYSLQTAQQLPGLAHGERQVIERYLRGTADSTDHLDLQDIANKVATII